jgi:hypothetical protein
VENIRQEREVKPEAKQMIIFQKLKTNLWTIHEHERNSEIFVRVNRLPVRDCIGSKKDSSPLSSSYATSHSAQSPI